MYLRISSSTIAFDHMDLFYRINYRFDTCYAASTQQRCDRIIMGCAQVNRTFLRFMSTVDLTLVRSQLKAPAFGYLSLLLISTKGFHDVLYVSFHIHPIASKFLIYGVRHTTSM